MAAVTICSDFGIFRTYFLLDWLVGSAYSPRDSQEASPASQFKSINSSALSFLYSPTLTFIHDYWKTIALTRSTFVGKVMSVFNKLSRLVLSFFPRSKGLLISWLQSPSAVILCWLLSRVWDFATPWTIAHQGFSVHGILQARILEWVAISFSAVILEPPQNKVCHCFLCFPIYLPWIGGTRCHDLSFLNVEF